MTTLLVVSGSVRLDSRPCVVVAEVVDFQEGETEWNSGFLFAESLAC